MKSKIGCRYCLMSGESGISVAKGNIFDDDENYFNHIEMIHDMPIKRNSETEKECMERFKAKNKRAGTKDCRCPDCLGKQRDLEILGIHTGGTLNE